MRQKKWYIKVITLISPFVILSGCLEFESIGQPFSVLPGEILSVFIEAAGERRTTRHKTHWPNLARTSSLRVRADVPVMTMQTERKSRMEV